jgi:hypothetical protein
MDKSTLLFTAPEKMQEKNVANILKKVYDNYYLIRHNMEIRRQRQSRFRPVNRKRESMRRRRNRRFR